MATPTIKLFLLLFYNNNFATVVNCNANIPVFRWASSDIFWLKPEGLEAASYGEVPKEVPESAVGSSYVLQGSEENSNHTVSGL